MMITRLAALHKKLKGLLHFLCSQNNNKKKDCRWTLQTKWSALAPHHKLFLYGKNGEEVGTSYRQAGRKGVVSRRRASTCVTNTMTAPSLRGLRSSEQRHAVCPSPLHLCVFTTLCTAGLLCILIPAPSVLSLCVSHMPLSSGVALSCSCFSRSPPSVSHILPHSLHILHPLLASLLKISSRCLMIDELLLIVYAQAVRVFLSFSPILIYFSVYWSQWPDVPGAH